MSTLFISHSSRDHEAAAELKARLEAQGHHSVFLDLDPEKGIQAGVSWERTLYTKLRACRAVVALCSENYLTSQWCFAEIALARMEGKDIFALQIDPWGEQTRMPSILTEGQNIDLRTRLEEGYERLWNGFEAKGIVPEEHRSWKSGESPYPGLRAFDERDAPIFFGRETEVREGIELLNRVRRQGHPRVVMVLGASGSGKSSLARAGLLPQLRHDQNQWLLVGPFRPGQQPARELAAALAAAFDPDGPPQSWESIYQWLEPSEAAAASPRPNSTDIATDEEAKQRLLAALQAFESELSAADEEVARSLHRLAGLLQSTPAARAASATGAVSANASPLAEITNRLRLQRGFTEASVVLIIDQFEELLGHDRQGPDHPANQFLKLLHDGIEADDHPPLVLATMRSDYLGLFQKSIPLEGLDFRSLSVGLMSRDGMRQVIEQPAQLGQIQLEEGLTEALLHDTGDSDALPLLAFTLRVMWDRYRGDRLLEIREYQELGGLQGAVAQVANETMQTALEKGSETDLRDAFLSLARPTEEGTGWVRQPLSWDELGDDVRPMLQAFIDNRLLVKREDDTIEVAHEALFGSWETLRGWLSTNAEALYLLREVQLDAAKWQQAESPEDKESYLWRGGRLARAQELRLSGVLSLRELDREFIETSHQVEHAHIETEADRQRLELKRARQFAVGAAVAGLVMAALFVWALALKSHAERVQRGQIKALKDYAWELQDNQPLEALVEGIRAAKLATRQSSVDGVMADEIKLVLRRSLRGIQEKNRFSGHKGQVNQVSIHPDGQMIATASADKTGKLWNLQGEALATLEGHDQNVNDILFHPDGRMLATASSDHTVKVWKLPKVWKLQDDQPSRLTAYKTLNGHTKDVYGVSFSPDGSLLASASLDRTVKIWRVDEDFVEVEFGCGMEHGDVVSSVDFSHDGRQLASASGDSKVKIWHLPELASASANRKVKVANLQEPCPYTELSPGLPVGSVQFSPTENNVIATASDDESAPDDKRARLWLKEADAFKSEALKGHTDKVLRITFSRDGQWLATAGGDHTVRLWGRDGEARRTLIGHRDAVSGADFHRQGKDGQEMILATASHDQTARLWKLTLPEVQTSLTHTAAVHAIRVSPNGKIVTASAKEVVLRTQTGMPLVTIGIDQIAKHVPTEEASLKVETEITDVDIRDDMIAIVSSVFNLGDDGALLSTAITLWTLDGKFSPTFKSNPNLYVVRVLFQPQGQHLGTYGYTEANEDGIELWDLKGQRKKSFKVEQPVTALAFSPDGQALAYADEDHLIKLVNLDAEAVLSPSDFKGKGHLNAIYDLQFSPDGQTLASASDDNTVRLWNLKGEERQRLSHPRVVRAVSFSPDGHTIATGGDDHTVRLWRRDELPLQVLEGHSNNITGVQFVDAQTLISTSADQTVKVWTIRAAALDKSDRLSQLSLTNLIDAGCEWLGDYLRHNATGRADAHLCRDDPSGGLLQAITRQFQSLSSDK